MKSGSTLGVQAAYRMSPLRFRGEREFPRSVVSRSRRSFPAFPVTFPSIRFLRKKTLPSRSRRCSGGRSRRCSFGCSRRSLVRGPSAQGVPLGSGLFLSVMLCSPPSCWQCEDLLMGATAATVGAPGKRKRKAVMIHQTVSLNSKSESQGSVNKQVKTNYGFDEVFKSI